MSLITTVRIEKAVQTYDFWMEFYGVDGRRRRVQRGELRANLAEAAADVGVARALANTGDVKALAHAVGEPHARRPRWLAGALAGALTAGLLFYAWAFSAFAFVGGVEASSVASEVTSRDVFPWLGLAFAAQVNADGIWFTGDLPWPVLVGGLLVLLLVARPWRAFAATTPSSDVGFVA